MAASKVYFTTFHTTLEENIQQKLSRLLLTAGRSFPRRGDFCDFIGNGFERSIICRLSPTHNKPHIF